MDWVGNW